MPEVTAFHAILMPEANKTAYQDQLMPEAGDTTSQAWFLPKNPGEHILAKPSDLGEPVANPLPPSRLYATFLLPGSSGRSPLQRQCLLGTMDPVWTFCPGGQDCLKGVFAWGEICS